MRFNTTIDNVSPLIAYEGAWAEDGDDDAKVRSVAFGAGLSACRLTARSTRYYGSTFTASTTSGPSASFSFNGTGVWIYGAKRGNHGPYRVVLDNVVTTHDGFQPDSAALFQTPLFSRFNLADGPHTVTITNQMNISNREFLDIDFVRNFKAKISPQRKLTVFGRLPGKVALGQTTRTFPNSPSKIPTQPFHINLQPLGY